MKNFENYGVQIPEILLPKNVDLKSWSVIACDQYTQDKDYWAKAADAAGSNPSTLKLIFPEVYLNDGNGEARIKKIHETMKSYLDAGTFAGGEECIYIERKTEYGRTRKGLVLAPTSTKRWPSSPSRMRSKRARSSMWPKMVIPFTARLSAMRRSL